MSEENEEVFVQPEPEQIRATFNRLMKEDAETAVAFLYDMGVRSGYIRVEDIARNIQWASDTAYGPLEITVNLSKPEKDPRAIAAALRESAKLREEEQKDDKKAPEDNVKVPLCDICWDYEGFPGTPEKPPKPHLRIVRIPLGGETWGLQYSPYAYFNEHCITQSEIHRPMVISVANIERLFDFVDLFPFYFIGSNADLPIVGGSILTHDHFQGGRHSFPLMEAPLRRTIELPQYPEIDAGIVEWPASTIRLISKDRGALLAAAGRILEEWRKFDDPENDILSKTDAPHNTLNPILHRHDGRYVLEIILRNNRTTEERPWGLFHPQEKYFHIKKENIGLIEIMGLAILPPRLAREIPAVQDVLYEAATQNLSAAETLEILRTDETTASHADWGVEVLERRRDELKDEAALDQGTHEIGPILREEIGRVFSEILEDTGVFKATSAGEAGWQRFLATLN